MQTQLIKYDPKPAPDLIPVPDTVVVPTQAQQQGWTLQEKLIYALVGIVVIGGTIYIGSRFIHKKIANKEENQTFEEGSSATVAKQIKMAFENDGWPGTDTLALRTVLRQIASREEFDKVMKSYSKLYNANLLKDMSDELQTTEYNEMLQIINGKPLKKGQPVPAVAYDAWAKRLKAAFDKSYGFFGGTDSHAIIAVLNEIPTQAAFIKVGVAYQRLYGTALMKDLKSESEFGQYDEWMKIIVVKRKQ